MYRISRILLVLLALTLVFASVSFAESSKNKTRWSEIPTEDKVPFPFPDEPMDPRYIDAVPIPPDTLVNAAALMDAEGYVPDLYSEPLPKASRILRPRYQGKGSSETHSLKELNDNLTPSSENNTTRKSTTSTQQHSRIRQASTETANAPPPATTTSITTTERLPVEPPSKSPALSRSRTVSEEPESPPAINERWKQLSREPLDTTETIFSTESTGTINDHSCDDTGCGGGCCSPNSSWQLRHLGNSAPVRGVCDSCGLLTCSRKYRNSWFFDGWMSFGSFMNTSWPDGKDNNPLHYNDRNGDVVLNQLYLTFGRRVNTRSNRWDIGGRIDLLYGTDYFYTSSLGLETQRTQYLTGSATMDPREASLHWNSNSGKRRNGTASLYGLSMPQAYAEIFAPIAGGITIKAGHFYADMGLESAMSPNNFFYSHSYGFMYGAPTTLTGMTATVRLSRQLSATFGFTQGWDVWDSPDGKVSALLGFRRESYDRQSALSFMVHSGENEAGSSDNRTSYVLTYERKLGERWKYGLEHSYGEEKNGALYGYDDEFNEIRGRARWLSLAQYLQWQCTETFALGFRAEWFHDSGHSRIQKGMINDPYAQLTGQNYYELTLGANWKPTRYITIRPEVRYDWANVQYNQRGGVYSAAQKREMVSFGIDAIFRF